MRNPLPHRWTQENQNGEGRAFVVSGQYEKVFPFDIYPVYLVKSIITNDIDKMETYYKYHQKIADNLRLRLCDARQELERLRGNRNV